MNMYAMEPTLGGPTTCCLHETDEEALECAAIKGAREVVEAHKNDLDLLWVIDGNVDVFKIGAATKVGTAKAVDAANDTRDEGGAPERLGERVAEVVADHERVWGQPSPVRGE